MDDPAEFQPRDEVDRLNSNDHLHEVSSLAFRLTDLHQPDLVQTLRLPVTAWPGEADVGVGVCPDSPIDSPGSLLPQQDLVDLCARLLNGVDLRFLQGRHVAENAAENVAENVAEKGREGRSTALVRLFEDAQPDIFGLASHASTSAPRERTGSLGENEDGENKDGENKDGDPARSAENKRRHAQVKINSPVAAEKKKRRASGSRPPSARVAVQGTGRAALTAEEETQKSLGALLALFESFNAAAAAAGEAYLSDTRRVLRDVQGLTSVAFGVRAATFAQIPREVLFSVIQNLGSVVRRGAGTKVYSTSSEGDEACLRAEGAMEAAVLAERLILKAHGADSRDLVIPEETLDLCVEATRFHLHNNLLPFHCPRIKAAVRPDLHDEAATDDEEEEEKDGDVEEEKEEKEEEDGAREKKRGAEDSAVRDVAKNRGTRTRSTRSATTGSKAAGKATLTTAKNRKKEENGEGGGVRGVKKEKVKGGGAAKTTTTTTTARGNNSSHRVPPVVGRLKDRVLASLDVISDITSVIKIQTSTLSPLVRTATQSLTVDRGLADVHGRCVLRLGRTSTRPSFDSADVRSCAPTLALTHARPHVLLLLQVHRRALGDPCDVRRPASFHPA